MLTQIPSHLDVWLIIFVFSLVSYSLVYVQAACVGHVAQASGGQGGKSRGRPRGHTHARGVHAPSQRWWRTCSPTPSPQTHCLPNLGSQGMMPGDWRQQYIYKIKSSSIIGDTTCNERLGMDERLFHLNSQVFQHPDCSNSPTPSLCINFAPIYTHKNMLFTFSLPYEKLWQVWSGCGWWWDMSGNPGAAQQTSAWRRLGSPCPPWHVGWHGYRHLRGTHCLPSSGLDVAPM